MASTTAAAYPAVTPSPISIPGPGSPTQFRTRTRTRTYSQSQSPSPSPSPSRQLDSPSPSPSNSSFLTHSHSHSHTHAYSPQKPPQSTPNAHPYAIKTTSTALLSRSTSSSASVGVHRYVPLHGQGQVPQSPSPTGMVQGQGEGSPTKEGRERRGQGRHRYSRSLTGEMPLPLPPPPGAASGNGHGHGHSNSTPGGFTYNHAPSPSPSERRRSGFVSASEDEDDDTPRRRGVRAETLPSGPSNAAGPFTAAPVQASFSPDLEPKLPDDPKTWTPAHLATYLASTSAHSHAHGSTLMGTGAGAGAGDALTLAVAYVQRKQMTGRSFMRLAEADLESNGLPAPTRAALLAASRSLRQRVMRGRIWGSEAQHAQSPFPTSTNNDDGDEYEHDFNSNNGTSSPFSLSRKNGVRPRRRSRHSSIASDSSDASSSGGRVRDMVDELERIHMDEEAAGTEGDERRSPVKRERESVSPTKTHRLPQRGAVTDLFSAASPAADTDDAGLAGQRRPTEEEEDGDSTITGLARRNVHAHGREPRLLPFPPTHPHSGGHGGVLLTPVHTGAQYVLPSSPEAVQQSFPFLPQGTPGPADYELGFRHALSPHLQDPHSQAYVVRHGASPDPSAISTVSSNGSGSNGNGKTARPARMLPYPPVVGHAALYHPRPRRVIGVGDEGLDVSSGATEADLSATSTSATSTSTTSDTEAWETATEGPSASEVGSIRRKRHVELAEDELSIEELLAVSNTNSSDGAEAGSLGPISGVAAWEMELGETVKRIAGSSGALPDANANANANATSVHEIGRKAGRAGTGRGRGGVGSVRAAGTNRDKEKKEKEEKSGGGKMKRGGIMALFDPPPEEVLEVMEDAPAVPEKDARPEGTQDTANASAHLAERENAVQTREDALDERERLVSVREVEVGRREKEVVILESDVEGREKVVSTAEREIEEKEMQLRTAQSRIVEREMGVEEREEGVRCAEEGLEERVRRVEEREGEMEARECELADRERGVEEARGAGEREREEVERRVREVVERERAVGERERVLLDMEVEAAKGKVKEKAVSVSVQSDTPSTSHASVSTAADIEAEQSEGAINPSRPAPYLTSPWAIKRDYILGRFMGVLGFSAARAGARGRGRGVDGLGLNLRGLTGLAGQGGGYLVLMSIGVCVVVLRVLGRRVGGFVGGAAAAAAGGGRR